MIRRVLTVAGRVAFLVALVVCVIGFVAQHTAAAVIGGTVAIAIATDWKALIR